MTATDALRQLLDERGVEWSTNDTLTDCWTRWGAGKFRCTATEINGTFAFTVGNSTPEQAVEATLGRGTCKDASKTHGRWKCSACGGSMSVPLDGEPPNYCPNCGRRIES